MKSLVQLIQKYKPLIILVIVPIGFTIIFGAAMSPVFVDEIPIAVLDMDESEASREILRDFYDCSSFRIVKTAGSVEELKEDILTGTIKGGLILPEGFGRDVAGNQGTQALMLMDGSNFMIGNNLMLFANNIFTEKNYELQISYMEEGGINSYSSESNINTLKLADRTLYNPQAGYFYYLFPGLLSVFIQQTYLNVLAPVLLQEKDRIRQLPPDRASRKIRAREIAPQIFWFAGLSFIGSLPSMLLAHWLFTYPLEGSLILILLLQMIFLACLTGIAFVLAAIFDDVTHCTQFVMFMAIPTMLSSGYGWPEFMMAPGFAGVVKVIWPLYYYNNPLKELLLKGVELSAIGHYVAGGLMFAAFWLPAGIWIYRRKIRIIRRIEGLGAERDACL